MTHTEIAVNLDTLVGHELPFDGPDDADGRLLWLSVWKFYIFAG